MRFHSRIFQRCGKKWVLTALIGLFFVILCATLDSSPLGDDLPINENSQSQVYPPPNDAWSNITLEIDATLGYNTTRQGNWNWAVEQPWCSGSGTYGDPYIIENLTLQNSMNETCLQIRNSRNYIFIVRDVIAKWASENSPDQAGIYLENTANGTIHSCDLRSNRIGIHMDQYCENISIYNNTFTSNLLAGIRLNNYCNETIIENNSITAGQTGVIIIRGSRNIVRNNTISACTSQGIYVYLDSNTNYIWNNTLLNNDDGIIVSSSCYHTRIEDNSITKTSSWPTAIEVTGSSGNCTIRNNTITSSYHFQALGISVTASNDVKIINNTVFCASAPGITISSLTNAFVSGNALYQGGFTIFGTLAQFATYEIFPNNTVNGGPMYYYYGASGLRDSNFTGARQVVLVNCIDAVVRNLNVSQATFGIKLFSCQDSVVANCTASKEWYGIQLFENSRNITVTGNNCTDNVLGIAYGYGIYLNNNVDECVITLNNVSRNGYGIWVDGSSGTCDLNTIVNNTGTPSLSSSHMRMIHLSNANNNLIANNTVLNWYDYGIYLIYSDGNQIRNNIVKDTNQYGVYLSYLSEDNVIDGNNITTTGAVQNYGVYMTNSAGHNNITNNVIEGHSSDGVWCAGTGGYNRVENNTLRNNNGYGVTVSGSNNNTILNNTFQSNAGGIRITSDSNGNFVSLNNLTSHTGTGVFIDDAASQFNQIYLNRFISSGTHCRDNGASNAWDNGTLGNYYDNFTVPDTDLHASIVGNSGNRSLSIIDPEF